MPAEITFYGRRPRCDLLGRGGVPERRILSGQKLGAVGAGGLAGGGLVHDAAERALARRAGHHPAAGVADAHRNLGQGREGVLHLLQDRGINRIGQSVKLFAGFRHQPACWVLVR